MNLFFIRHGIAEDKDLYSDDADRPLSAKGIKEIRAVLKGISRFEFEYDLVLSSPVKRAVQTAEMVAEILKPRDGIVISSSLGISGEPLKLVREINRMMIRRGNVVLVGHEPYLSKLIGLLLTGANRSFIRLKKGGFCRVETQTLRFGKCAELKCLLTPSHLMSLKG